jgi:photosystem II stability/assembly factor-like uncharacterized protein
MKGSLRSVIGLSLWVLFSIPVTGQKPDPDLFKGISPRQIGPAGMSGRVTAIDVVHKNPDIIYIGTASGGLWRSKSGGIAWEPLFDSCSISSIGAVAICQDNPDVIWAGTGEGNPRNSQSSGNGIYKSIDGGKTWKNMGLSGSRNIHRILINRNNPDVVYAGVQGNAWGDSPERGVFKTTDGGISWKKILYVDERTGIADLVEDPGNPDKLIAAMWEFRREPWFFKSGGPGSGLYVTYDGGNSWAKKTSKDGLPEGELGRMGIAIAPGNTSVIYALIESKKNGLYRSEDGGFKWKKVSDTNIGDRPFYFSEIYVDPHNENRIYNLFTIVSVSEDGGKTFQPLLNFSGASSDIHPDHHAWWVHPDNPDFLINGNDGGLAISRDRGKTWNFIETLPLGQFYHVNVDMDLPYHIYGGLQDNGTFRGPAYVWREEGIRNNYWQEVLFGDGFDAMPDPSNSRYGYAMSQGGELARFDVQTGQIVRIKPVHPDGTYLRFNWNAGMAQDPFDPSTIYYGSQFLHSSHDKGNTWEIISPDLTTNDNEKQKQFQSGGLTLDVTSAENYCTIIAIAPSPKQQGVIWVGTDDGNLQMTTNGGKSWTNLTPSIKGFPKNGWIPHIHASAHNPGEVFVVVNNYRQSDWTPYLFHTIDFGKTWENLIPAGSVSGYMLSVVQDPVAPNLIFSGTEQGLYFTVDYGKNWSKWNNHFPSVSTMDLAIHPRESDLVIGTFGRSIWVMDDIRPFREIALKGSSVFNQPLHIFAPPPAYLATLQQAAGPRFAGNSIFAGENRPSGAMITCFLKQIEPGKNLKDKSPAVLPETDTAIVRVYDEKDSVIRTFKTEVCKGMNRFTWDLCVKAPRFPGSAKPTYKDQDASGYAVVPGNYKVKIAYHKLSDSVTVNVNADPRITIDPLDLKKRQDLLKQFYNMVNTATQAADRLTDMKSTLDIIEKQLGEGISFDSLKHTIKKLRDTIDYHINLFIPKKDIQGLTDNPELINSKLGNLAGYLYSLPGAPVEQDYILYEQTKKAVESSLDKINSLTASGWKGFEEFVKNSKLEMFREYKPIKLE